ncbi:MAG: 2-C-methyl-D-erythritol 4-phosphate cytidylyltransferase [Muribaculaceae bacterium]|nr:2-C-methyl-D-erythritol 4-phosphate cytidylyltransferase [Muribaculaceae bacterium]
MRKFAIILAGGTGSRAGGDLPKQFQPLCGRPVVWWSMQAFRRADPEIEMVLVVHPGYFDDWQILCDALPEADRIPFTLSCGGRSRPESVANGLLTVRDILADRCADAAEVAESVVLVHDGARPLVSPEMIRRGLAALRSGCGAIPAVEPVSSLREVAQPSLPIEDRESRSVARNRYVEVQTPQIFHYTLLRDCYSRGGDLSAYTDDASVAEAAGHRIHLYRGEESNLKVTHPSDFLIAGTLLRMRLDGTTDGQI